MTAPADTDPNATTDANTLTIPCLELVLCDGDTSHPLGVDMTGTGISRLVTIYVGGRVARREIRRETATRLRVTLRGFSKSFGNRNVKNMSKNDIERWIATRRSISLGSLRAEVVTVRGFVNWLREDGKLGRDPMATIKNPKVPRSVPRAFTAADSERLLSSLPDARAVAAVMLGIGLGLRLSEIVGLQMGDWDRGARTLRVTGKGGHTRLLPMPERVGAALVAYVGASNAGPLIRRTDGVHRMSSTRLGQLMSDWMYAAGVKGAAYDGKSCHALRHTLASDVADVEPDLRVLQAILGHVSLSSTQIYLRHAEMAKVRAALEGAA
jgi:integrase/recombinase XerC